MSEAVEKFYFPGRILNPGGEEAVREKIKEFDPRWSTPAT